MQLTSDPATKVLVGCCNEDGTWKTGGSVARKCLNPNNMCQSGHCTEDTHVCEPGYTNAPGTCVVNDDEFCVLGECQSQQCVGESDPDLVQARCDDGNECTSDTCGGSTTYELASCSHSNLTATDCFYDDTDPCTKGQCNDGACTDTAVDVGAFCGTAIGTTCSPAHCDETGQCVSDGDPIVCTGTLPICKKWSCDWNGTEAECTAVKKDYATYPENDCDDNPHDCNVKRCNKKGKCAGKAPNKLLDTDPDYDPDLDDFVCDSNWASPLPDCIAGRCDAQKNCHEEVPIANPYPDETCQSDSDVCTLQTCQGTTCTVTSCSTGACGTCEAPGTCSGTPPNCVCVQ